MAYNFIVETTETTNWTELREFINGLDTRAIEAFPIFDEEESEPSFLGISIPFNKLDQEPEFWTTFLELFKVLTETYKFKVYDLYHGFYVTESHLPSVKKSLYE